MVLVPEAWMPWRWYFQRAYVDGPTHAQALDRLSNDGIKISRSRYINEVV